MCFLCKKYNKAEDLIIRTKTVPPELLLANLTLIKFNYDIARPENSENFHGCLNLHQNNRTKQLKVRQNAKTSFGMNLIISQCVQKWNKLPQWLKLAKMETFLIYLLQKKHEFGMSLYAFLFGESSDSATGIEVWNLCVSGIQWKFLPESGTAYPYLTPCAFQCRASVNAIPHHYWIIDWLISVSWFARLALIHTLQWLNLRQFWFFIFQTCANSDFIPFKLAPTLIFICHTSTHSVF